MMDKFNEDLNHLIKPREFFDFNVFGIEIPVTDTIINMWIIMAIMMISGYFMGRNLQNVPNKLQNFAEILVSSLNNIFKDAIGHHWKIFAPYLGTILLFLALSDIVAIFNFFPFYSIHPPTKDIIVTGSLAVMSMFVVIIGGIKVKTLRGWLKSFLHPLPLMLPFNILEYLIKPFSLCLRLFGNILAATIVMSLIYFVAKTFWQFGVPLVIPAFMSIYFDLFDGLLQAYIFTFLTSLYIGEAVEEH